MLDVFLGIMALGAVTTLVLEVAVAVMLVRAVLRTRDRLRRLSAAAAPIAAHLDTVAAHVQQARATAEASRARLSALYAAVERPARMAMMAATLLRGVAAFAGRRRR